MIQLDGGRVFELCATELTTNRTLGWAGK